jgi:hypothetical protein
MCWPHVSESFTFLNYAGCETKMSWPNISYYLIICWSGRSRKFSGADRFRAEIWTRDLPNTKSSAPPSTARCYITGQCVLFAFELFRVEAGSNTSTVTLRVVGGDEKGSLQSEIVKYGHESQGTRTRNWLRWREPGAIINDRPVLSSERAPHINKPASVWQ